MANKKQDRIEPQEDPIMEEQTHEDLPEDEMPEEPIHAEPPDEDPGPTEPIPEPIKAPDATPESFFVYLGPSVRGAIQKGAILMGTREVVETRLGDAIAKYPLMRHLLIPGSTIIEDRIKVETPNNLLYQFCKRLEKQIENDE